MINSSLSGILQDAIGTEQCRQILLVSRVGTMIASADKEAKLPAPTLGPIVASTFATSNEVSRLLVIGEQDYQLQRGRRQDLLLCSMPSGMILAATFPVKVDEEKALDLANHLIDQIEALTPTIENYANRPALGAELRDEVMSLLDEIFPQAA
jgi:hypothetical protein